MDAINWIKEKHIPYDGEINNDILDEEKHNYQYYLDYYTNPISLLFDENIIKNEKVVITLTDCNNIITFPSIFTNIKELNISCPDTIIFNSSFPYLEKLTINCQKVIIAKTQPKLNYLFFTAIKKINYNNEYDKIDDKTNFIISAKRDFFIFNKCFVPKLKSLFIYNCKFETINKVSIDFFEINKYFNLLVVFRKCNIKNLSLLSHNDLLITDKKNTLSEFSRFNNFYQCSFFLRAYFIHSNIKKINCLCNNLVIDYDNIIHYLNVNCYNLFVKNKNYIKKININFIKDILNKNLTLNVEKIKNDNDNINNLLEEKEYIKINSLDKLFYYFSNINYVNINFDNNEIVNLILNKIKFKNCNKIKIINCLIDNLILENMEVKIINCEINKLIINKSKVKIKNSIINLLNDYKNIKIENSIIKFI